MSKKKKEEVVIIDEELKPTVLATIKERKINFVGLILLFALFLGVIYLLPTLSEKYQEYKKGQIKNPTPITSNNNNNNTNTDSSEDDSEDTTKYNYSSDLIITKDSYTINNFSLNNNILSFTITNNENEDLDLTNQNYYLNVYNSNKALIKAIKIVEEVFNAQESKNYTYNINASTLAYFTIEELQEDNYPEVTLTTTNGNNASLICRKDNDVIRYTFVNKELTTIMESMTVLNTDLNYQSELLKYQSQVNNFNGIDGLQSNITENENSFIYSIVIDLNKNKIDNFNNLNYYNNKTLAKVVKFEVEARGFTCN